MGTIKSNIKNIHDKWVAETPVRWKRTRDISAAICGSLTAGLSAITLAGGALPEGISKYVFYVIGVAGTITFYAGTRTQ
jgi:hypothetical protein